MLGVIVGIILLIFVVLILISCVKVVRSQRRLLSRGLARIRLHGAWDSTSRSRSSSGWQGVWT